MTGILILVGVSFLNLIPPRIVGTVVDEVRFGRLTPAELVKWCGLLLLLGVVVYVLRFVWRQFLYGASTKLSTQLRNQLYQHFSRLSPQFYHKNRIGDLMAHATNDVQAIEATAGDGILTLFDSITTGAIVVATMVSTISWKLTLIVLIPMPFMAWTTSYYGSLLHKRFHKAQEAFSNINDKVQENISGMRVVKAFGQEEVEKREFEQLSADVVKKNVAVAKIDALFDPTISLIVGLSYFLAVAVGAAFVVKGPLTIGQLTSFTMYLGQLIWPMLAFGWLFNIVERGRASHDRVKALLAIQPDVVDRPNAVAETPTGDITYHLRSFAYPDTSHAALRDISISLRKGDTLGVVGKTGSGKTTLLRLLLREFDCQDGDITFGGTSIYAYTVQGLRSAIGYVPQDHFLFSATITENIAFAVPDASLDDVQRVAKIAAIHDDIERFEEGYRTVVGERGVTLSGGQKQRISIARSLLMDAEVLILDDALSAVDAKTESQILQSLKDNRASKTTLIASHRLSAIEHANLIVVLDEGRIVERGTHEQLMKNDRWYASMYRRQQLEALVEQGGAAR